MNAEWAIDPWPLRAKGLIVLVSPNRSDRKGNNKVSKCKLKKYLFGKKTKESVTLHCAKFALIYITVMFFKHVIQKRSL